MQLNINRSKKSDLKFLIDILADDIIIPSILDIGVYSTTTSKSKINQMGTYNLGSSLKLRCVLA